MNSLKGNHKGPAQQEKSKKVTKIDRSVWKTLEGKRSWGVARDGYRFAPSRMCLSAFPSGGG